MRRVWYLDDDRVDHRHVRGDRAAVVEEARIIHAAPLVVDVFLAECPADALGHAALDLALDIAGVDGAAGILRCRVAQDLDVPGLGIDLDIAEHASQRPDRHPAR
jgi:hypothetical protein